MIRMLIILLLIVGCVMSSELPLKSEIVKMNDEQKDSLYSLHDKNKILAVYLNIIPSLGHVYTGNWIRGLSIFGITFGGSHIINKETRYNENIDTMSYVFVYSWFWIFLTLQDVDYLSGNHNAKLYEYIYDEKYPQTPKKSIIQKFLI